MLNGIIASRIAANKLAVTRSAVAPGLRPDPGSRNHVSKFLNDDRPRSAGNPAFKTAAARCETSRAAVMPSLRAIKVSG